MEEGFLGSALGKLPPAPSGCLLSHRHSNPLLRDRTSLRRSYSLAGSPQPVGLSWPAQKGRGSPSLKLAGQLIQDLHGLPVVFQLGIHQGRELAHLLNLQATSQS